MTMLITWPMRCVNCIAGNESPVSTAVIAGVVVAFCRRGSHRCRCRCRRCTQASSSSFQQVWPLFTNLLTLRHAFQIDLSVEKHRTGSLTNKTRDRWRLRSDDVVAPRKRTWPLTAVKSEPSCRAGDNSLAENDCVPIQLTSAQFCRCWVLGVWPTSGTHRSSWTARFKNVRQMSALVQLSSKALSVDAFAVSLDGQLSQRVLLDCYPIIWGFSVYGSGALTSRSTSVRSSICIGWERHSGTRQSGTRQKPNKRCGKPNRGPAEGPDSP